MSQKETRTVRLVGKEEDLIDVLDMKDGQLAIIVEALQQRYVGRIVQRCDTRVITLGVAHNIQFEDTFDDDIRSRVTWVRLLRPGDRIKITEETEYP